MDKVIPILFNTDMVRAIQKGTKTVTRRVVKAQESDWEFVSLENDPYMTRIDRSGEEYPSQETGLWATFEWGAEFPLVKAPYQPGDILYVRETWTVWDSNYEYKADVDDGYGPFCSNCTLDICAGDCNSVLKWRPSIHMPREAARIFLRVTDVRVEQLQDITEEQARAEGAEPFMMTVDVDKPDNEKRWVEKLPALVSFPGIWDSTIKPADRDIYGWDANPWVWVIEFERCEKPEEVK